MKTKRLPRPLYCNDIVYSKEMNDSQSKSIFFKVEEHTTSKQFVILLVWIELTILQLHAELTVLRFSKLRFKLRESQIE